MVADDNRHHLGEGAPQPRHPSLSTHGGNGVAERVRGCADHFVDLTRVVADRKARRTTSPRSRDRVRRVRDRPAVDTVVGADHSWKATHRPGRAATRGHRTPLDASPATRNVAPSHVRFRCSNRLRVTVVRVCVSAVRMSHKDCMATEVTPPRHSRRGRTKLPAPLRGRRPASSPALDHSPTAATPPELLEFVKALARDLARADAMANGPGVPIPSEKGSCAIAAKDDTRRST